MKSFSTFTLILVLLFLTQYGFGQLSPSFVITPLGAQTIPISLYKMTNLVFPAAITAGVKVSRDVSVRKVKGLENVIEIKAVRKAFSPTNISIFCRDGRLYSFNLYYSENSDSLNFIVSISNGNNSLIQKERILLSNLPVSELSLKADGEELSRHAFMHKIVSREKLNNILRGIYLKDSLLWIVTKLHNQSAIPFNPTYIQLWIAGRKQAKRTALQRVPMSAVYSGEITTVAGHRDEFLILAYPLFTIAPDKFLELEVAEETGSRRIAIKISHRLLLRARAIDPSK